MFAPPLKCPYNSVTFLLSTLLKMFVDEIFIGQVSNLNSFFPGTAASIGDSPSNSESLKFGKLIFQARRTVLESTLRHTRTIKKVPAAERTQYCKWENCNVLFKTQSKEFCFTLAKAVMKEDAKGGKK